MRDEDKWRANKKGPDTAVRTSVHYCLIALLFSEFRSNRLDRFGYVRARLFSATISAFGARARAAIATSASADATGAARTGTAIAASPSGRTAPSRRPASPVQHRSAASHPASSCKSASLTVTHPAVGQQSPGHPPGSARVPFFEQCGGCNMVVLRPRACRPHRRPGDAA